MNQHKEKHLRTSTTYLPRYYQQTPVERQAAEERSRRERWRCEGLATVTHPDHGSVVVPHQSKLAAIMCAAEVWGCNWTEILDAEIWRYDK